MTLHISNRDARRLWLAANGLGASPTGPLDVMAIIHALGFLQLDTIRNVTRAHNHILWSRNQNFREGQLWPLLEQRHLFEHFTHDASLIPMAFLPNWGQQFQRMGDSVARSKWYQSSLALRSFADIRARIETEGPLSTHAFDTKVEGKREMWARPPHKKALDQMWYAGQLATARRENFVKYYNLAQRVFPKHLREIETSETAQFSWLCDAALTRLWLANPAEIQRFWGAVSRSDVNHWLKAQNLIKVEVASSDGSTVQGFALADIQDRLHATPKPTGRLRIINPFDPAIRDRARLQRLFGFYYRNEMFVPKTKRKWGYYVYPLLEGDCFVGRIELKADRKQGQLTVTGFWQEPGIKWHAKRQAKLDGELNRFARFVGIGSVIWLVSR